MTLFRKVINAGNVTLVSLSWQLPLRQSSNIGVNNILYHLMFWKILPNEYNIKLTGHMVYVFNGMIHSKDRLTVCQFYTLEHHLN